MKQYDLIQHMLADVCAHHSNKTAFSCLGQSLSFGEIDRLSQDFAAYLQHHTHLAPGDRIAIQLPNLLQYPVVLFGALRAGVVIVNTNPLYTGRELVHQLQDSGAKVLVVLANLAKAAEAIIEQTAVQQVIVTEVGDMHSLPKRLLINSVLRYVKKEVPDCTFPAAITLRRALSLGRKDSYTEVQVNPDAMAFLQYTGGTTGVAKGAILTQTNLLANKDQILAMWSGFLTEGDEVFLAPLPFYHIYGFTLHCLALFSIAGESVLVPNPRDIAAVIKAMQQHPLTGVVGLNTLFVAMMRHPKFAALDFSSLRITTSGGMALAEDTAKRWHKFTGVWPAEGYGLTETSPIVAVNLPDKIRLGSIGRPLPATELRVIDGDGKVLPAGEAGELCVRGPQVMSGYWQQAEATGKVLSPEGWFSTGDIAVIDDEGYVRIVDRAKDMIVVSGFNVYPNEVETVLVSHPDILEAAVIGVPDRNSGEAVKAFIVAKAGASLDEAAISDFCRELLTAYKVPRFYAFRKELPKTPVGKVLRRALRETADDASA
ncbi:MAG: AMP-binding protein [Cellvibrionaceae bacterium]|nr:AMP-binding protein [Cellvibrionaceae bacterium]